MALDRGLLLDTHTLVWLRDGRLRAAPEVLNAIRSASDTEWLFVCGFSFYEIAHAVSRKRMELSMPLPEWLAQATAGGLPTVLDITPQIAAMTFTLPATFHGDPGDRIIAATAMHYNLVLCTHDKQLLRHARQGLFAALKVNEAKESDAHDN